mmetsp:Transcript_13148/g.30303  ORF Transcript_13148/g.30303 Transcript_13148/m.30303 type:complete len:124 (-) Transcript_13148:979-1350(-)
MSLASSAAAFSCLEASSLKTPPSICMSSCHVPVSMITPCCTTAICSEWRMVLSRCAIVMVVFLFCSRILSSAACTFFSADESSAEVASSSSRTSGFFTIALAIATRCFCPPESCEPPCPTFVS